MYVYIYICTQLLLYVLIRPHMTSYTPGVRLGVWGVIIVVCVCVYRCRGCCSLSVCVCVCVTC